MIVMTGANGRLGRAIAKALARRGAAPRVTLLSRDPSKLADLAALGFKTGRADFADPASLPTAFAGATTALIISVPGPIPERIPLHRNAFDAAQQAHVGRLIYTSRVNPAADSLYPFAEIHAFSEGYLKTTGLPTTIVRNNEYMENITKIVSGAKDPGKLLLPGATGGVAYIALTDIAEIVCTLLLDEGHAGKTYELNGPEALSRADIARIYEEVTMRPTTALPITRDEYADFMKAQGRPAFVVDMCKGLYEAIDAGEFANVWPDAARLLGRQPQSFSEYLRGHPAT